MRKISMSFVVTLTVSFTVRQKKIVNSTSIESHKKNFTLIVPNFITLVSAGFLRVGMH